MALSSNIAALWALPLVVLSYTISYIVYQLFLSPLRAFPGPIAAKVTPFWLTRQCRRTQRSKSVEEEHRKYGDFVRVAPNHVSIQEPTALVQIYGHKTGFTKGQFYDAFLQVRPVVFTARDVSMHQKLRKYLNPAFSSRALLDFESIMDTDIRHLEQRFDQLTSTGPTEMDFSVWANYLAFDVIGNFAFGKPFGFVEQGKDSYNLIKTIDRRGETLNALGTLPRWLRGWMRCNFADPFWTSGLRATSNLEKIGRDAYLQRKATGKARKDLLSFLIDAKDPDTGAPLREDEIVAESISFIVGGSDTTSNTMTNFIDFVSRDVDLQRRIQHEIDRAVSHLGESASVIPDKIAGSLPLMNATLKEVMRCRPTSSTGLERVTPAGGKTISGIYIPEGTLVSVPTLGLHNDPRTFSNPDSFDPQRWLQPDSTKLMDYFQPFSYGPRSCIGRNFAWMEMVKTLATLLRSFHFERVHTGETVIREGFFCKAVECKVLTSRR